MRTLNSTEVNWGPLSDTISSGRRDANRPLGSSIVFAAVVIRQYPTPRSYIVVTPDGTQMRQNRFHLQTTKEEAPPVPSPAPSPAWVVGRSDEPNSYMQPSTDAGLETPDGITARYPARVSTRMKKSTGPQTTTASYRNCIVMLPS